MRYIIIGGAVIIVTLLVSKIIMAVNLTNEFHVIKVAPKSEEIEVEQTGKSLYLVYCSSCHGYNGKGNNGKAQDHTQRIAEKSVLDVIENGSNNFSRVYASGMPAGLVNKEEAKQLAKYVANGLQGEKPTAWQKCASCHNEDGTGIAFIAPNIKTYSDDLVTMILTNGKKGIIGRMPSFKGRLNNTQIKAIAAYIRSMKD